VKVFLVAYVVNSEFLSVAVAVAVAFVIVDAAKVIDVFAFFSWLAVKFYLEFQWLSLLLLLMVFHLLMMLLSSIASLKP